MDIERLLEEYRRFEEEYPVARAHRVYLEEFRKTKLALLAQAAEAAGIKTVSAQDRDAHAHTEYREFLDGMRQAIEREERCRFHIKRLELEIEVWRTTQANERFERKTYGAGG